MPYNNYYDYDKHNPKLYLSHLAGINNPPTPAFFVYFNNDSVVLECLKLKFIGNHKVLSTYSIPFNKVITMEVIAEDTIDEVEQSYSNKLGLKSPIFKQSREIIRTLSRFQRPNSPVVQRIVVLSLAYYSVSGEVNDLVFAINTCGVDLASDMAKYLRIKIGIDEPDKPEAYFLNEKGEYQL